MVVGRLIQFGLFGICAATNAPVWLFALLLVTEFYLRVVIVTASSFRLPVVQTFRPFDPDAHEYGQQIGEYFLEVGRRLVSRGFSIAGPPLEADRLRHDGVAQCLAVFERSPADRALVHVTFSQRPPVEGGGVVELHSRFADGSERITESSDLPVLGGSSNSRRVAQFASVADPLLLLDVHDALVEREEKLSKAPYPSTSPAEWLAENHTRSCEDQLRSGSLVPSKSGESYRPTWLPEALMAWVALWPFSALRHRWYVWQSARAVRRLGLDRPDVSPVTLAMPSGPRPLWALFGYFAFLCLALAASQTAMHRYDQALARHPWPSAVSTER
jgi:hypothetical protein